MKVIFCTSNAQKFLMGDSVCKQHGLELVQKNIDLDEVQSEDAHYVAVRKAEDAFKAIGEPLVVSDDSWSIHGLNGFPGVYAKSVNAWLTNDDYLRLTRDLTDRTVTLMQKLVFKDEHQLKTFTVATPGVLLNEARGKEGAPIQKIVSFETDGSLASIAETLASKNKRFEQSSTLKIWREFADWIKERK